MTKSKTLREQFEDALWNDGAAPVICEEPNNKRVYDLEVRTARFGEAIIDLQRRFRKTP